MVNGLRRKTQTNATGNCSKRSWIWILLAVMIFFAYRLFINPPSSASNLLGLNQVAEYVRNGSVKRIVVQGDDIIVEISDSERRRSRKESGESLLDSLKTFGVTADQLASIPIDVERAPNSGAFFNWLIMLLPMILIFGFFILHYAPGGRGRAEPGDAVRPQPRQKDGGGRPPHRHL